MLFYFPIIFTVYQRWVATEETFLEGGIGNDYLVLKREVPRWGFQVRPAPARGSELTFQRSTYAINHEVARSVSHICLMSIFVLCFVFGNPLVQIDFWIRLTLLAVIAVWLVVRDVYAIDGAEKSVVWSLAALGVAMLATVFLASALVWQPWSGAGAWTAIAIGLYCSLAVTLSAFPGFLRAASERKRKFVTRPLCQWYILALGFGLLSCSLAGLWIGVILSLAAWALTIGRWLSVKMVPPSIPIGVFLLGLVVATGSAAVLRQLN